MKKKLLAVMASMTLLSAIPTFAEESESTSTVIQSSSESLSVKEAFTLKTAEYLSQLVKWLEAKEAPSESIAKDNKEIVDFLKFVAEKELETEHSQELLRLLETRSFKEWVSSLEESERQSVSKATETYLQHVRLVLISEKLVPNAAATDAQVESAWKVVKLAQHYGLIQSPETAEFKATMLKLAAAEYRRLVLLNFNEDGTFKDTLYSKHMLELYALLKDEHPQFVSDYALKQDSVLQELAARKAADQAIAKIEEKRSKGETITDEEFKQVEQVVEKVQTHTYREVASVTKEAVVTSQTNQTQYEKQPATVSVSISKPKEKPTTTPVVKPSNPTVQPTQPETSAPKKDTPKPVEPVSQPVEAVESTEVEVSQPAPIVPKEPEYLAGHEYGGRFATVEEAYRQAYEVLKGSDQFGSFFVSEVEDGYDLYYEYGR